MGIFALLFLTGTAHAVPVTYTDRSAFLADLPDPAQTLDFDSTAAGTAVPPGSALGGFTFDYDFGGVSMAVTDGNQFGGGGPFATTSGSNFLGTDDLDLLQDGDDFDLSFSPSTAIGLTFITADWMFDDDVIVTAGGTSVGLSVADGGSDLGDGGVPYFIGLIDPTDPFASASITTIGGGFFLYNVDDITTARDSSATGVPQPGTLYLIVCGGLVGVYVTTRQRTRSAPVPTAC